jgi:hypothetical protein
MTGILFGFLLAGATAVPHKTIPDFGANFVPSQEANMNGDYASSTTPGGTPGLFPIPFRDYPGGVETYDVLTPPITTLYSQVWWAPLAPVDLPSAMVKKYSNASMAIVGWEIDQVQLTADGERSVPISASYNHHYIAQISGAGRSFAKVMLSGPDDPLAAQVRGCVGARGRARALTFVHVCVRARARVSLRGTACTCFCVCARVRVRVCSSCTTATR